MKPISRFRDSKEPITILWDWCCWQEQMGQKPWMYQSAYCQLGIMAQCTMNCHSPQSEHVLRQYLQLRYTRLYCKYLLCNQFSAPRNLSNWSSRMEERHLPQFRWCSSLSQLTYYWSPPFSLRPCCSPSFVVKVEMAALVDMYSKLCAKFYFIPVFG